MNSQGSAVIENAKGFNQTVEAGICTGVYNVQTGTCNPPCTNCNGVTSVQVTPNPTACLIGTTMQFTATAYYYNGNQQNVTSSCQWSSSNTSLATVSSGGLMTSLAIGSPTITATLQNAPVGGRVCNCIGCPPNRNIPGIVTPNLDSLVFNITSGGTPNDSYGVIAKSQFTLQIQAKSPTGTTPDTLFTGSYPFYVLNLNTALGEAAPSDVSFSSGTANANVTLVSASGTSNAPSSVRQIYVFAAANDTEFFPYLYWYVTMGVELSQTCGTACGYSVCPVYCAGKTLPAGSSFVALPNTSACPFSIFVYDKTTGRSGSPSMGVQDIGPHTTNNPYWFTGNYTPGSSYAYICGSDAFISSLGGSPGCAYGSQVVYWRFTH
jgi:hypothetical protein